MGQAHALCLRTLEFRGCWVQVLGSLGFAAGYSMRGYNPHSCAIQYRFPGKRTTQSNRYILNAQR